MGGDLRTDTVTKPTPAAFERMAGAQPRVRNGRTSDFEKDLDEITPMPQSLLILAGETVRS
jgi:hypothetical protein